MTRLVLLAGISLAGSLWAQETGLGADFRKEGEQFRANCVGLQLVDCAQTLFTDNPLHIAVGSLAPQNGFGAGLAFTAHYTPNEDWRLFWNADAIATPNGSWRAGGYMTAVLIRHPKITIGSGSSSGSALTLPEMPVLHAFAQSTSLNTISYYGLGQDTGRNASNFGMTETIAGGNVVWPLFKNVSLLGEANGRFISIRGAQSGSNPSIYQVNDNFTAPGLASQPAFAQFGQGIRVRPSFANGHVRLNYTGTFQEWIAGNSANSFRRFSADLSHQFPLYRDTRSLLPQDFNGPDMCATDPSKPQCPLWPDDPAIPNMKPSYNQALAQMVGVFFPEILYQLNRAGQPEFPEFAARIKPTEFEPGKVFGAGTMAPVDYMIALAEGREPLPKNLNIRFIQEVVESNSFRFHFTQYAQRRAADWKERGFAETLVDFKSLNERSKFWGADQRAAFKNWEETDDIRRPFGEREGIDDKLKLRELLRRLEMKVMQENRLDLVVRLHYPLPPGKIGLAPQPQPRGDVRGEIRMGPHSGETEVLIPAGYVQTVYDPVFTLSADKKRYVPTINNTPSTVPPPGLPFSLVFRAEPGREDVILKVASAYQMASKRRVPPPMYKPLPGEP